MAGDFPNLVGTEWLAGMMQGGGGADAAGLLPPGLRVLDATWLMPADGRRGVDLHRQARIPGAVFLDLDAVSDPAGRMPHTLAPAAHFSAVVSARGIRDDDTVIVYDAMGLHTAPRAWWLFKAYGHQRVAVLDGGLRKWRAEGRPVESGDIRPGSNRVSGYQARDPAAFARTQTQVSAAQADGIQVVDARSAGRYRGDEAEPRPGLRAGHIPGSRNVPYTALADPETGEMLGPARLMDVFQQAGVDVAKPIISTCGSGVTACVVRLALAQLGAGAQGVYDGSWTEWGSTPGLPVATGPQPG